MTVATGRITERVQSTVEYHFRNVEWFGELRGYIIGASDDTFHTALFRPMLHL